MWYGERLPPAAPDASRWRPYEDDCIRRETLLYPALSGTASRHGAAAGATASPSRRRTERCQTGGGGLRRP
ncbi:hypothetical protein EYF80_056299 [Liparis tanakae]|uniref:Uncharacterized protein n=1 Tax=Liparis tanakae TaxID=230148 RepID=A0A4Z2EXI7_9TELE|nr:hypothetical protein EYF80_056299 [Liparis tanakae]